jgi:hypothetical protein
LGLRFPLESAPLPAPVLLPSGSDSRVKILGIGLLQWNVFSLSALAADSFFEMDVMVEGRQRGRGKRGREKNEKRQKCQQSRCKERKGCKHFSSSYGPDRQNLVSRRRCMDVMSASITCRKWRMVAYNNLLRLRFRGANWRRARDRKMSIEISRSWYHANSDAHVKSLTVVRRFSW